ncbi:hypothetical protein [Pseudomonas sp. GV071]|jgi:hypothetical protein|uniref:hypothetical protein n=1 Tax=Pseudomonas sp. GV071 TaxID=2135754 RepID=UPI000D4A9929|nr:hypothetical protein [Pseudomonas sp. GV071]PTQ70958.1 hypothetical protein C8K61_10592 [Pseudomonas sp. GV071]
MQRPISLMAAGLIALMSAVQAAADNEATVHALLADVTLADGVSQLEAQNIAKAYFIHNVGCGAFNEITDGGENWVVQGGFGYSAEPIVGFVINKQTGALTSPIGPDYTDPLVMLTEPGQG